MTIRAGNVKKKENPRKALSAIMMVAIMLFSTQMYSFQDFEKYDEDESVWGDVAKRTAFQQFHQADGPMAGGSQGQPAAENPFMREHFMNPSYHDPMSVYGKVSAPSALNLDSSYGFFLEETNAEDAKAPEPVKLDHSKQLEANFAMVEQSVKLLRTSFPPLFPA